jgi:hypothetical protein
MFSLSDPTNLLPTPLINSKDEIAAFDAGIKLLRASLGVDRLLIISPYSPVPPPAIAA